MTWVWLTLAAMVIGVGLSVQPMINGISAQVLNSVFAAAALSMFISTLVVLAVILWRGDIPQLGSFARLPWWIVLGGIIGAAFVSGSAALVPVMGASAFFICLIAGQLMGAVIADAIGAFGLQQRDLSLRTLLGVTLAFVGVVLVRTG